MGTRRWRLAGRSYEGLFGEYRVKGCPFQDDEGVRGWHTSSRPVKDGIPIHDLFVDGTNFRSAPVPVGEVVSGQCSTLEIEDRLISIHPAERSAIAKAIAQWEYEGA
jgi:hypothetical protein